MKRRRGRRGFWWWSWLLAVVTIVGVVGGFLYGKKLWEEGPKDYVSSAKLSVHIRAPFVASGAKDGVVDGRLDRLNEEAVLRGIKSDEALVPIVRALNLSESWGLGTSDALAELRGSVELDYNREVTELYIIVSRHDANEAAAVANLVADGVFDRVKSVDEQQKLEGAKKLELELKPFATAVKEAKDALKTVLVKKGFTGNRELVVDGRPISLDPIYLLDPAIMEAHLELTSSLENFSELKKSQGGFERHWKRDVRPTVVVEKAEVPLSFVGPKPEPIQRQWALYGMTLGLILGSVLALICWKLFP